MSGKDSLGVALGVCTAAVSLFATVKLLTLASAVLPPMGLYAALSVWRGWEANAAREAELKRLRRSQR